ncbi:MAG: Protein FecR [Pseudomonas citronellolis]|nr:MAG: Protein FecR [Pseudomonas citronellolis]
MNSPNEQQQIRQQAAEWAVLLHGGALDSGRRQALDHWLAVDGRHAAALQRAQRTWDTLGLLGEPSVPTAAPRTASHAPRQTARAQRRRGWPRWAAAAVLMLALDVAWEQHGGLTPWLADYATGKAEQREVTLDDGSQVLLDAQSAIELAYSGDERRVRLLAGNAIFHAAPRAGAETRPFVVESAGGTTRALGTRFVVSHADDGVRVGVLEHRVDVAVGPSAHRELGEGESLRYRADGSLELLGAGEAANLSAWQRGLLIFDAQPLGEVVTRLNQYRPGHLLVADTKLAQRRVSGVFRVKELDGSLQSICEELGIRSASLAGVTLLY